ncbi:MAG: hypothetical protein HZB56_14585 [Deltaproteobacteria bacterium]|nr:hypothetical protein [Deltaproteobacteria bacterium]
MGYGHLRAARPLADELATGLLHADREPLADARERKLWHRVRSAYEAASRLSQVPVVGAPLKALLDRLTEIPPLHPRRDLSAPTLTAWALDRTIGMGLGEGMVGLLRESGRPLLTTFFAPALVADRAGLDRVYCVVTDTDVNRAWVPVRPGATRIRYLVPTLRTGRRLEQYGVPAARIRVTGFPLPGALLGGPGLPALRRNLAARVVRLDPRRAFRGEWGPELDHFLGELPREEERRPPLVTFAVGGAGAQAELARRFLPALRKALLESRLRLALVAGVRPEVRHLFEEAVAEARLAGCPQVEILQEPGFDAYYEAFNALLARTDVLWTKPSEMTFYAALGLPMICAPPVGVHEQRNRRWVREAGAGLKQRDPAHAGEWLLDLVDEGALAAAAWAGYVRLPKFGLRRILEEVAASPELGP